MTAEAEPRALPSGTGFRTRLMLSQLALLLALMVALVIVSVIAARPVIEDGLRAKVESKGKLIAYTIALDLALQADLESGKGRVTVNVDDMRGLLKGVGTDAEMTEVVVYSASKSPLVVFRRNGTDWEEDRQPSVPPVLTTTERRTALDRGRDLALSVTPVMTQQGTPVGWVEMRASTRSIERLESSQVQVMLLAGAVALGLTAGVSVLLGNRVTRSVTALSLAAARIGAGERHVRVETTSGHDELAMLARTFNAAMDGVETMTDALTKANADLSSANGAMAEANVTLAALNKELDAFSYSVSHDLRAPLRGIDGFSQALLEDYEAKLDETGKDYLHRIRAGARRMGALIDDLLGLSRLSQAEMNKKPVNLSAAAAKVVEELRTSDPGREVKVEIAPGLVETCDPALVSAALENLLRNAWKYSSKRSDARIEVGKTVHEGRDAYFVRDNGAGFDMAHASKLFGAFQRLHSMQEFEGNGVGLATVQRIIARHGGRVWAEGAVGKGATFYFTLG